MLAVFVGGKETTFGKRNIFQFIKTGIGKNNQIILKKFKIAKLQNI